MSDSNAAAIAADSLGLHMLREIIDQFEQLPGYANLTSAQQQVHIERLDKAVRGLIAEALGIIFSAEYPACLAILDRITVGKEIVGRFHVERSAESRHELMDRAGQKVVVVMADPDRYYQRMTEVKARSDQGDLFHDPSQPLGHMGVDSPPSKPEAAPSNEGGVEDVLPDAPADDAPIDIVTADSVWAALQAIGYRVEVIGDGLGLWSDAELHDCMVWAIAAKTFHDQGKELPPVPGSVAGKFSLFRDEGGDVTPPPTLEAPPASIEKPLPPEPLPAPDDIVGITAALKGRGVKIKGKEVSRWSQSQRVAAVSWLAGRTAHRPDFIPEPETGSEAASA